MPDDEAAGPESGGSDAPQADASSNRDARRRRRNLYGPPPRLTRTSPLQGRLLWYVGDWGRASEHIGARWEAVGTDLARARLEPDEYLLVLAATPELMSEVFGTGLPHADAIRCFPTEGGTALGLEPLDFKWSLETASVKQVASETVSRLIDLGHPRLREALDTARAALRLPPDVPIDPHDGRFLAPESAANFTARRADPRLPCALWKVDPQAFFRPLPGWDAAVALARLEGADLQRVQSVDGVERYYRLGAGVAGALTRLGTGLFEDQPAQVDVVAAIGDLRRSGRGDSLNALLVDVQDRLQARRALEDQVQALPRAAYPFSAHRADLARLRAPRWVLQSRGALGRAHGEVVRFLSTQIRAEGRSLVQSGVPQDEALARLNANLDRWAHAARPFVRELVATLQAQPERPGPVASAAETDTDDTGATGAVAE